MQKNITNPAATQAAQELNSAHSILILNAGSSSIKFSIFQFDNTLAQRLSGKLEINSGNGAMLTSIDANGTQQKSAEPTATKRELIINFLIHWLEQQNLFGSIRAVGHRVVHGMHHTKPERVTESLLNELHHMTPFNPDHLPLEIGLMEAFHWRHPALVQVACFDTAFHRTLPRIARLLPIPRRYAEKGIERYGFHGLSYAYLMHELARHNDPAASKGRIILAHLGNGASMTAVRDGKSIDTSMGFTPTGGLPMGTRMGDIDPGLIAYLERTEHLTAEQIQHMVNYESGLLGISETSSDVRELLKHEAEDTRAAEAIDFFCYEAKKLIGAYAAALGGLDTLIFTGGIGENSAVVRAQICDGLGFLGIHLHKGRNFQSANLISTNSSSVKVRVIPTREDLIIARSILHIIPNRRAKSRELVNEAQL
jgi:acetate kinase